MLKKKLFLEENRTILTMSVPSKRASQYMKENPIQLKRSIDKSIIAGDFKTPVSVNGNSSRQNNSKDMFDLKSTILQHDQIDT